MKTYKIVYDCPHCPHQCDPLPDGHEANELLYANSKTEARAIFQAYKPCRWQKITRIEIIED